MKWPQLRRKKPAPQPPAEPSAPVKASWTPLGDFLSSWLGAYRRAVFPRSVAANRGGERKALRAAVRPASASPRLLRAINATRPALIVLGVVLLTWLIVDLAMILSLPAATYAPIAAAAAPVLAIATPAVVGYWTNYLAITMLFRPRRKNAVWVGIIPSRKDDITALIAASIRERLVSPEIIREYLQETGMLRTFIERNVTATGTIVMDASFRDELKSIAKHYTGIYATNERLQGQINELVQRKINELAGRGVTGAIIRRLREAKSQSIRDALRRALNDIPGEVDEVFGIVEGVLDQVPAQFAKHIDFVEREASKLISAALEEVDVATVVQRQFGKMDEGAIEAMLKGPMAKEIVFIQTGGGVLGLLLGIAVAFPVAGRIAVLSSAVVVAVVMRATMPRP